MILEAELLNNGKLIKQKWHIGEYLTVGETIIAFNKNPADFAGFFFCFRLKNPAKLTGFFYLVGSKGKEPSASGGRWSEGDFLWERENLSEAAKRRPNSNRGVRAKRCEPKGFEALKLTFTKKTPEKGCFTWWAVRDSNPWLPPRQRDTLPTELTAQVGTNIEH